MPNEEQRGPKFETVTGDFSKSGGVTASGSGDTHVQAPVLPKEHAKEPKVFVHRVTLEYKTVTPQTTPQMTANAMLMALSDADDNWVNRTKIVEAYEVKNAFEIMQGLKKVSPETEERIEDARASALASQKGKGN